CAASALHPLHRAKVPRVPRLKVAKPLLWSTMENRPYQQDALDAISTEYDKGTHRQLLVMATGTGKTICFSKIPELFKTRLPGQTLILAHTEELVEQNRKKIQEANPNLKVGKEMAGDYADETNDDIISASVQTLGRLNSSRALRFNWSGIDKLIVDEAHHSVSDAYSRVFDYAGVLHSNADKLLLGVTATSQRPDGRALSDVFEKIPFVYSIRQAITDKWLVPIRGFRVTTETDLSGVEQSHGDYVLSQLSKAVDTPVRNRHIVAEWKKLAPTRKTVCFTTNIDHARHLCESFCDEGVKAEYVYGEDPDRAEKLKRHQNGETQVLCNCSVLTEGYDDPDISCIVLCRPTASGVLYVQMVGRGTRLSPATDKQNLIVIDVVDASIGHSLMTLPTLMGLQNILDLKGRDMVEVAEEIEALQEEHPSIDWTTLKDVDELKTLVQQIDMFEIRFPKEVEENSELIWFRAVDGGYKMLVPKDGPEKAGFMHVFENQL